MGFVAHGLACIRIRMALAYLLWAGKQMCFSGLSAQVRSLAVGFLRVIGILIKCNFV